jgi:hypothetical protein
MPNWVDNDLIVSGDPDILANFAKDVCSTESCFDFEKILPYPDNYRELDELSPDSGYNSGGHDWCMDNWGTKLPADEVDCDDSNNYRLNYIFITAWSPPTPIIKYLAQQYPDLTFELKTTDPSMGWHYTLTAHNGQFEENTTED